MGIEVTEQPRVGTIFRTILLLVLVIILPAVNWSLFGWMQMFLPLTAFVLPSRFGAFAGGRMLLTAAVLALVAYALLRSLDMYLFSSTLLFSGYVLFLSAQRRNSPSLSGLKGCLALAAAWLVMMTVFSFGAELSSYGRLLQALDEGLATTGQYYQESESVTTDNLLVLESTILQLRAIVPVILPAMLGFVILALVWFTMVVGNLLLLRTGGNAPWPDYRYWQLPEKLVWLLILAAGMILMPVPLVRAIGINLVILLSVVYCFQGLAITIFFMNKWKVPILFRSFFYVMIVFQSLGTLALLILGIAENWIDFRKLKPEQEEQNQ